MVELVT